MSQDYMNRNCTGCGVAIGKSYLNHQMKDPSRTRCNRCYEEVKASKRTPEYVKSMAIVRCDNLIHDANGALGLLDMAREEACKEPMDRRAFERLAYKLEQEFRDLAKGVERMIDKLHGSSDI